MRHLKNLHEEFIDTARRPMNFNRLPVIPTYSDTPIIPTNRWATIQNSLNKTFSFRLKEQKNDFVRQLLIHEEEVGHYATITITKDDVALKLSTGDVDKVTELDKEYARWADELYKDVVYSLSYNGK